MIQHVEILRYRCHRFSAVELQPFQVLTGRAGAGKTALLDALRLLSDMVAFGLDDALEARSDTFTDLLWQSPAGMGAPNGFEIAVECPLPADLPRPVSDRLRDAGFTLCRYELEIGADLETGLPGVRTEKCLLMDRPRREARDPQQPLFPADPVVPRTILSPRGLRGTKTVVHKLPGSNDKFYDETGDGWDLSFRLGTSRLALAGLPEDEQRFPVARWLRRLLIEGVRWEVPDLAAVRRPLPPRPGQPDRWLLPNASNLAVVVARLQEALPGTVGDWTAMLRLLEPDLVDVRVAERPIDRARCLTVRYRGGAEVPAGSLSEGLLRYMALSLPSVVPPPAGLRLIESPETGQHPDALEAVARTLQLDQPSQRLVTTRSPDLLRHLPPGAVLNVDKDETGATIFRSEQKETT